MKTKAKYVIVILFLCTIPLYFCRMIGWKDDAIRLYDVSMEWKARKETLLSEG